MLKCERIENNVCKKINNRKLCHFYHITRGLGKKIKSNSGLFECQFYEIEVNANNVVGQLISIYATAVQWQTPRCAILLAQTFPGTEGSYPVLLRIWSPRPKTEGGRRPPSRRPSRRLIVPCVSSRVTLWGDDKDSPDPRDTWPL